jgi:hypothetical protein
MKVFPILGRDNFLFLSFSAYDLVNHDGTVRFGNKIRQVVICGDMLSRNTETEACYGGLLFGSLRKSAVKLVPPDSMQSSFEVT